MSKARYVLAIVIALFAVLTLLDRFVLFELLLRRITVPLLFAVVEAIAFIGLGALVRRAKPVDIPLDFLIGYPLFGALCFLAGTLKVATWTMLPLMLIGAVRWSAGLKPAGSQASSLRSPEGRGPAAWKAALLLVLACGFVAAQAPPSSLDELAYHLAVPRTWALEGRAIELPLLSHSYFPLGIESADLPALSVLGAIAGGIASHFLHFFAAIATTLLIARRTKSWLVTAAIVTTPALAMTAGWSLVDWPLAGLFVALYVALEDGDTDTASAATAAGLLVKYTFIPFAIIAWAVKRKLPTWTAAFGVLFFVRNLILTGNPIAPFFSGDAPHVSGFRALELASYVFESTFVDEALGAGIVTLPVFAIGGIAFGSLALAIALFFFGPSSRILVPFLIVPSISAAPELRRRVLAVFIAIAVVIQTFMVVWLTGRSGAFTVFAGSASEEEYLRKSRPSYASIEWMNQLLPDGSRTLLVGHGETYWFARPVRGGGNFDGPRMSRYLDVPTPEALRARLQQDGITHVAVMIAPVPTNVAQKVEERRTTLTPPAQRMLATTLDRYAASVTSRGNATVFTLK
jgi:hypothetical protein